MRGELEDSLQQLTILCLFWPNTSVRALLLLLVDCPSHSILQHPPSSPLNTPNVAQHVVHNDNDDADRDSVAAAVSASPPCPSSAIRPPVDQQHSDQGCRRACCPRPHAALDSDRAAQAQTASLPLRQLQRGPGGRRLGQAPGGHCYRGHSTSACDYFASCQHLNSRQWLLDINAAAYLQRPNPNPRSGSCGGACHEHECVILNHWLDRACS